MYINTRTGLVISAQDLEKSQDPKSHASHRNETSASGQQLPRLKSCLSQNFLKPMPGTWAESLLGGWENPIFDRTEEQISCMFPNDESYDKILGANGHGGNGMTEELNQTQNARITKMDLAEAQVISQVDSKFILVKVTRYSHTGPMQISSDGTLVLIDQHAADERIKVEELLETFCKDPSPSATSIATELGHRSAIETHRLGKPVVFEIDAREQALFEQQTPHFARWGVLYDFSRRAPGSAPVSGAVQVCRLEVLALPPSIAERCRTEPKLLVDMLRGEAWRLEREPSLLDGSKAQMLPEGEVSWVHRIQGCPQGILDMINSRSCRSAIMFNDELSLGQCTALVRRLSQCVFPFQCAHGRPSMVPLVSLGAMGRDDLGVASFGTKVDASTVDMNQAWTEWMKSQ